MVKRIINSTIKKASAYKSLEAENIRLKTRIDNFDKYKKDVQAGVSKLKKRNSELEYGFKSLKNTYENLTVNLKNEIQSFERVFIENNIEPSYDFDKLTIIVHYRRTDDVDREASLDINLRYLSWIGISNLVISEYSDESFKEDLIDEYGHLFKSFKVVWNNSEGKLYNLALAVNKGVMATTTPYFAMFDSDCLTKKENIGMAIALLDVGFDVVHPFNRRVTDIVDKKKFIQAYDFKTVKSPEQIRLWADGGIVFWNKISFINIGMKNEYFDGWGGEDNETTLRANMLQINQYRIDDTLYHLYHHRTLQRTETNYEQFQKTKEIENKEDLLEEINKWPWVIEAKKKFLKDVK